MTDWTRRTVMAGFAAFAASPAMPAFARPADQDAALRAALDGIGDIPGYAGRRAALDAFDPAMLPPSARIDLITVRNALALDARIAALAPGGRDDGPYRVPLAAEPGIWRAEGGAAAYPLLLERNMGAPMRAEAAHASLEAHAKHLTGRADRLMHGLGHARGSVGARFKTMFADPQWHYPDTDAGRDAAAADMNGWLDKARAALPRLVGPVPPECRDVSVRRMTPEEVAAGKGGYRQIAAPTQSGIYFVDLKDIARRPRWTLESVVHHETLPGHMVQLPIEAAADPHPLRLAYLPGYPESWAVHAEQMMAEHDAYRGTPLDELGHVHWLLFRVARGLIDTGIHHRRWSVDQARARFEALMGEPVYFASFDADVDRVVKDPAGRAAEALTWLAFAESTRSARTPAQFVAANQRILAHGRKPLRLLRDEWGTQR